MHLGRRSGGTIELFKEKFPPERWRDIIKKIYSWSKKYAVDNSKITIEVEKAKDELDRILTAQTARKLFYGYTDDNFSLSQEEIDAIVYGLENPTYELDSIAYVELGK